MSPNEERAATAADQVVTDPSSNLRANVAVVRRRWRWVALGLAIGLLGGAIAAVLDARNQDTTTYYKANHTLLVRNAGTTSANSFQQLAFLVRSQEVVDRVAETLEVPSRNVSAQLTAVSRADVFAIDVVAIATDPQQAVAMADTAAEVLAVYTNERVTADTEAVQDDLSARISTLRDRSDELEAQIDRSTDPAERAALQAELDGANEQIRLLEEELTRSIRSLTLPVTFTTLQTATPVQINQAAYNRRLQANVNALGSISPGISGSSGAQASETDLGGGSRSGLTRLGVGGATGLLLGIVTAFIVEAWDDRLRRRDRVEAVTGITVIAQIPRLDDQQQRKSPVAVAAAPRSQTAERYRSARTSLMFSLRNGQILTPPRATDAPPANTPIVDPTRSAPVIIVTSPNPGEGKTTTVANLAAVFAETGVRTLVIDCDYRRPAISRLLVPMVDPIHPRDPAPTWLENVWMLPAPTGGVTPGAMLASLRTSVEQWRDRFDLVLLDTPPMLVTNDATDLLPVADGVVLVIRAGHTRVGPAERIASLLRRFSITPLGVILNDCANLELDMDYGYYGAYDRYYTSDRAESPTSPN